MSYTMRVFTAFVLFIVIFSQFCVAAPAVVANIASRSLSVIVPNPARIQNVPVARVGVPFMFQLDPNTFTAVDSDSGAPTHAQLNVTMERDSNIPQWIHFDSDRLIFTGTPDAIPDAPFRIRLVATAPEGGDQNDTAFDLYVSDSVPPYLANTLERQQNMQLMRLVNATRLSTTTGVWIRPGAEFTVQLQPFCNASSANSSLYYSAYHPSPSNLDPLPSWVQFDNATLSLSGVALIKPASTDILFRCSNVYGAGGIEQRLTIDVAEHELELDGAPLSFEFTPGAPFKYNFQWLYRQLYVDGDLSNTRNGLRFSNNSLQSLDLNAPSGDIGISFSLDKYSWLYFDSANQTVYGVPPVTRELPVEFPSVPLNISYDNRQITSEIQAYSLNASPWSPYREAGMTTQPDRAFSHNFASDLIESVRSNPNWNVFAHINDPFNSSAWLVFNSTTRVLNGSAPLDSPSREINVLVTSDAWGFNTSIFYSVTIDNPNWSAPLTPRVAGWNVTAVTVVICLVISVIFLAMFIFILCALQRGCLISPFVLFGHYRRRHRSSQTLVGSNSDFGAGCCKGIEVEHKHGSVDGIEVHVEYKVETLGASHAEEDLTMDRAERGTSGVTVHLRREHSPFPSLTSAAYGLVDGMSPAAAIATLAAHPGSATSPNASNPPIGTTSQQPPRKKFTLFKERVPFGKRSAHNKKTAKNTQGSAAVPAAVLRPHVKSKEESFTPLWKGHIYQTSAVLKAEEDAWKARRLERKARLKQEYFEKKEAEAQGRVADTRFPQREESDDDDTPKPGAPRRFGIFEQLAKMENLDRKGPANMRGSEVPRSRLVEVGENRFFDDTMLDRSEVGSSEFSSLASWETLSESSVPNMVLCYGQLGRRKTIEGVSPRPQRAAVDPWGARQSTQSLDQQCGRPQHNDDTLTDENLLDRVARSLGSEDSVDERDSEIGSGHSHDGSGTQEFQKELATDGVAVVSSPVKWKGKGVARGEHGSPTTSQHSPTFKRLARQRFQASIDGTMGSPLSRVAVARALALASPSAPSIVSGATQSSANLSSSGSMASLAFHIDENGVHYYVIPTNTRFCFTAKITKKDDEEEDSKPTFGRAKAAVYSVQMDDAEDICMPLWLHFNAPGLEFWGHSPDTVERIQHSMRIVHRATNDVVGRLSIVVTRAEDVVNARASLGYPIDMLDAPGAPISASASSGLAAALALTFSPRVFGTPLQPSRSVGTSYSGTELSSSGSMRSIVFHLNRDGMHFFVIPAQSKFCFEAPINKPGNEAASTKSTFGRATASPYVIQMDESDTGSIPLWLHFVPQSTEFWGEAPDVVERLRVSLRIVHRHTDEVVAYLTIIVAQLADVEYLRDELDQPCVMNERLSVVEEVSSVGSNDTYIEEEEGHVNGGALVGPKTPERSYNVSVSSSRGARSWRGMRSQPGSKHGSPASRRSQPRSLVLGTPLSKYGQRTRMRTPVSGHMATYEDYDSVMFEGRSLCSESMFGPELGALIGSAGMISNGALDAMSRAASRAGSVNFGLGLGEKTVVVVPTMMSGVEYYVIRGGVDFRFALQMKPVVGKGELAYGVEIEVGEKEGWKYPEWLSADLDGETGVMEFSGSTHGVEVLEEQTLVVYESQSGEEVKRIRVVVVPDSN